MTTIKKTGKSKLVEDTESWNSHILLVEVYRCVHSGNTPPERGRSRDGKWAEELLVKADKILL